MKRAIQKYGIDNFTKEILEIYNSEKKMNLAEKILVVIDQEVSYNICSGGTGGFGYINSLGLNWTPEKNKRIIKLRKLYKPINESIQKVIRTKKERHNKGLYNYDYIIEVTKKAHTSEVNNKRKETFKKIDHAKGEKNSQYGTCWITNGIENKKIKKEDVELYYKMGYTKGRIYNMRIMK